MSYIVEIGPECWLAPWQGDPGRTSVIHNAKTFASESAAKAALTRARQIPGRNQLPSARIVPVHVETRISPIG